MALEYRLTLAGQIPLADLAARAFPDPVERPTPYGAILTRDLYDRFGFGVSILGERHDIVEAEADAGLWGWDLDASVDLTFRMGKDPDRRELGVRSMLEAVGRVLESGSEDAALTLNGDLLLLTRMDGAVSKHNQATWWNHYPFTPSIIAG
ncbi:MAG: hypothetical protein JXA67_17855 [Micromonosporaceae bacterium]|nr:hypothetical protein [Micromonosporaceae bacterium]